MSNEYQYGDPCSKMPEQEQHDWLQHVRTELSKEVLLQFKQELEGTGNDPLLLEATLQGLKKFE